MSQRGETRAPVQAANSSAADEGEDVFAVGQYLKSQRVMRGISTEELSLRTRIPRRSIERLEAGAFDGELDGFVRGFVRTVSDGLGLDPDDTLVRMLHEPVATQRRGAFSLPPRAWAVLAGLAVLVVAIIGITQFALPGAPALAENSEGEAFLRRDPVRALAEAQAASPSLSPAETPSKMGAPHVPDSVAAPASAGQSAALPAVSSR